MQCKLQRSVRLQGVPSELRQRGHNGALLRTPCSIGFGVVAARLKGFVGVTEILLNTC